VDELDYHLDHYDEDEPFFALLRGRLLEGRYDFVFSMNYFGVISDACESCGVRYVCWTCDSPLISMYHASIYNDCNYIFCFDKSNCIELQQMGAKHIYYLPLAVDTERIDHVLEQAQDLAAYENEIAFVGSLYERNSYDRMKHRLPDYLQGYFEAVIRAQLDVSGGNIIEDLLQPDILAELEDYYRLEKSARSFANLGLIFSTTVLGFQVAKRQRRQALQQLGKRYQVGLYTNSDASDLLGVDARGGVDYWTEMPKVFRMSKINLNFTIPNILTGIPLRVWDVLGAGGFLMTNYQAELPLYLENKKDYVCFEDLRQLEELAGYYLSHEEERCAIAAHGYETVKKKHSYRLRVEELLRQLQKAESEAESE
jgi:spore maturation protein CgeB